METHKDTKPQKEEADKDKHTTTGECTNNNNRTEGEIQTTNNKSKRNLESSILVEEPTGFEPKRNKSSASNDQLENNNQTKLAPPPAESTSQTPVDSRPTEEERIAKARARNAKRKAKRNARITALK